MAASTSSTEVRMSEKPTLLIVQGSFQTSDPYKEFREKLISRGFDVVHPILPSCTDVDNPKFPSITLIDDALVVRSELIRLIEYCQKAVFVIMHSYGGLVGSEAVAEDLTFAHRQSKGLKGGVVHLFYFSAFVLAPGQSVIKAFGESPNNDIRSDGRFTIKNAGDLLYSDLPPAEASFWSSKTILQSYKVQTTVLTRAAYEYIPSTYVVCEDDRAVPAQYQEMFAGSIKAHVERCKSGHSPQLSHPDFLVEKVIGAIDRAINY